LFAGLRARGVPYVVRYELGANGVAANQWHHAAATLNSTTHRLTLYLDGLRVADAFVPATSVGNLLPLSIGRSGPVSGDYRKGAVDDVRIWNVVRKPAEIAGSYRVELASAPPGLVGNWKFDEGRGSIAADSAGPTAQDLSLFGGATWLSKVRQTGLGAATWWDVLAGGLSGVTGAAGDLRGRVWPPV
jgi:hypothetical protein